MLSCLVFLGWHAFQIIRDAQQTPFVLHCVNYNTARLWILKARDLFLLREKSPLTGLVEVDESIIGGPAEGYPGRALGPNPVPVWLLER